MKETKFYKLSQGPLRDSVYVIMRALNITATPAEQLLRQARRFGYADTLIPMPAGKVWSGTSPLMFKQLGVSGAVNARTGEIWRQEPQDDSRPPHMRQAYYTSYAQFLQRFP